MQQLLRKLEFLIRLRLKSEPELRIALPQEETTSSRGSFIFPTFCCYVSAVLLLFVTMKGITKCTATRFLHHFVLLSKSV